jgi:hypothetical protein
MRRRTRRLGKGASASLRLLDPTLGVGRPHAQSASGVYAAPQAGALARPLAQPEDFVGLLDQERVVRRAHDRGTVVAGEAHEQRPDGDRVRLVEA